MKNSQNNAVSVEALFELAKKARAQNEEWVQGALVAFALSNDPALARALVMKLRLPALGEMLDPLPFDTPAEKEFA